MEFLTQRCRVATLWLIAFMLLFGRAIHAQPSITVPAPPAEPWTMFSAVNSDRLLFTFERDPTADNTMVPMALPAAGATFNFTKDGSACPVADSSGCSGSDVSAFNTFSGTVQIINIGEATTPSVFGVTIVSTSGAWQVNLTTNASIQSVHVIPDVVVNFPAVVPSGQVGVTLDASGSHSVFEPSASAPVITSYSFTQTSGTSVTLSTSGALGEIATFDAPTVTSPTDLEFEVTINDGTFSATETITVTVSPPDKPVDAVLAIDTSGSMGWHRSGSANDLAGGCCSRLSSAKFAARYFVERLGTLASDSRVGVAIFPGSTSVDAARVTPATGLAPLDQFFLVISDIGQENPIACGDCLTVPGSPGVPTGIGVNWRGTPTRPGLDEAKAMLMSAAAAGERSHIMILLSDGAWNSGGDPADPAYLSGFVINGDPVRIYTLGMGTVGADDVNHASLQDISVGTGVGTPGNPIGFCAFNLGEPATEPNLIPCFEKILTDMVSLDFTTDPSATIRPGDTVMHKIRISGHDSLLSATISWESSQQGLLDFHMVSPSGQQFDSQISGHGYRNLTLNKQHLSQPGMIGEWSLVVNYLSHGVRVSPPALTYSYSMIVDSSLKMTTRVDKEKYFTGQTMILEARLTENNRRLSGAEVVATVQHPNQGFGQWQAANIVIPDEVKKVPDTISGEPLDLLNKKNHLLLAKGTPLPKIVTGPALTLNDKGEERDKHAGDGIYTVEFADFKVPGIYKFTVTASGTAANGDQYTRQTELDRYVDVALAPDGLASAMQFEIAKPRPFFPDGLVDQLQDDPPRGFVRVNAVFEPRDAEGNLWGPGHGNEIEFKVTNAQLLGDKVDELSGVYVQVIEFERGAKPEVIVSAGGVSSQAVPVSVVEPEPPSLFPWWVWLLFLVILLLVLLVVFLLWRQPH